MPRNMDTLNYTDNSSSSFNYRGNTSNSNNLTFSRKENNTSPQNIKTGRKYSRMIDRRERSLLSSKMKKFLSLMMSSSKVSPSKNYVQTNNFLLLMKVMKVKKKIMKRRKNLYL